MAILKKKLRGRIFLGCDNHPLSRLVPSSTASWRKISSIRADFRLELKNGIIEIWLELSLMIPGKKSWIWWWRVGNSVKSSKALLVSLSFFRSFYYNVRLNVSQKKTLLNLYVNNFTFLDCLVHWVELINRREVSKFVFWRRVIRWSFFVDVKSRLRGENEVTR